RSQSRWTRSQKRGPSISKCGNSAPATNSPVIARPGDCRRCPMMSCHAEEGTMIGYLFHTTDGRWLLYLEDGTILRGRTRKSVVAEGRQRGLSKVVRYAGKHRPSEVAMTVADLQKEGKIKE